MELNSKTQEFNEKAVQKIDRLSTLLSEIDTGTFLTSLPINKKLASITDKERNIPLAESLFEQIRVFTLSNMDEKSLLEHLNSLHEEWERFLKLRSKLTGSIKDGDLQKVEKLLPTYIIAYNNLSHNLSDIKQHYKDIFDKYIENFKEQVKNSFYIGIIIAVSTLILLFFLLMEVNSINSKLQTYLEEKESFQRKLAYANEELKKYSQELEEEVKKRTDEALEHLMKNPLTKLHNRLSFVKRLEKNSKASVAIFNIDRFQSYNDLFGAKVGDKIIQEYAAYLRNTIPYLYEIYHLQGDEFAIIEPDRKSSASFLAMMKRVSELVSEFHYSDENGSFVLQVSIGVCIDEKQPLTKADMALKKAKNSNERLAIYSDSLIKKDRYLENITMTKILSKAIKEKRVVPYYQAICDTKSKKVVKYEALARLFDENGNIIPPAEFIDLAKQIKLYSEITKTIFDKALESAQKYGLHVSVNLSADDIHNPQTRDYIIDKLAMSNFSDHITIELLESEEAKNYDEISAFIKRVKVFGVKVAIDDFGSGYSNFAKILKLKVDYIKIDGSFIRKIDTDQDSREFVEIIHKLASNYNLKTVAEFVSNESIYNTVLDIGIDYVQGYKLGRPIPIEKLLEKNSRKIEKPEDDKKEIKKYIWD
ncbi:MAG: GGDEF and EAL domain-containing protein [Hydrogenimonas sp.]|nr:GGDEF and EAL domain-containing protein [Hydrogenimonas sp.]